MFTNCFVRYLTRLWVASTIIHRIFNLVSGNVEILRFLSTKYKKIITQDDNQGKLRCTCVYMCVCVCMYVCMHSCGHKCIYVCMRVCIHEELKIECLCLGLKRIRKCHQRSNPGPLASCTFVVIVQWFTVLVHKASGPGFNISDN